MVAIRDPMVLGGAVVVLFVAGVVGIVALFDWFQE